MGNSKMEAQSVTVQVKNIGGISDSTIEFSPGVTLLTGRNATNRTSLLQSIMAALGSKNATVKGDAEQGKVQLTIGESSFTRRLTSENGTTVFDGDPYLEDNTIADLFAFLLETNQARQAVTRGDDLRQIIMEPIDTQEIENQINQAKSRRENLDKEIETIERKRQKLPELKDKKASLEKKVNNKKTSLTDIQRQIENTERDVEQKREEKQKLESKLDELNDARNELESVRQNLSTQKESIDALQNEQDQLENDLEASESIPEGRIEEIESEIQRLRDQKESLNGTINELQTVIEFNEGLLDGNLGIFDELNEGSNDGAITNQLVSNKDDIVCWTCGTVTDTGQIQSMVTDLEEIREKHMNQRSNLNEQIDDRKDERQELKERRQEISEINQRLEAISDEIDNRESRVSKMKERRSDLTDRIENLETEVTDLRNVNNQDDELLDLHKEANKLEVELERLETDLEDTEEQIQVIEHRIADREELENEREEIREEIEDLRTRVQHLEEVAANQFNEHMESVLEILEYDNIERIWIERIKQKTKKGRKADTEGKFELHVVRTTGSGAVYEDTVDHLSESEREVTGFVFALAGYLVHDVSNKVPFMLIDSVESIDAPRIAKLVEYFEEHTNYLLVALLEEDAQELDDQYQRITDI